MALKSSKNKNPHPLSKIQTLKKENRIMTVMVKQLENDREALHERLVTNEKENLELVQTVISVLEENKYLHKKAEEHALETSYLWRKIIDDAPTTNKNMEGLKVYDKHINKSKRRRDYMDDFSDQQRKSIEQEIEPVMSNSRKGKNALHRMLKKRKL